MKAQHEVVLQKRRMWDVLVFSQEGVTAKRGKTEAPMHRLTPPAWADTTRCGLKVTGTMYYTSRNNNMKAIPGQKQPVWQCNKCGSNSGRNKAGVTHWTSFLERIEKCLPKLTGNLKGSWGTFVLEQQWQVSLTEAEPGTSESLGDSQPQESICAFS